MSAMYKDRLILEDNKLYMYCDNTFFLDTYKPIPDHNLSVAYWWRACTKKYDASTHFSKNRLGD